jgi:hypothetical protein
MTCGGRAGAVLLAKDVPYAAGSTSLFVARRVLQVRRVPTRSATCYASRGSRCARFR